MVQHASGQNYMIGDAEMIGDFESSAAGTVPYGMRGLDLFHTNHPLASDDFRPGEKEKAALPLVTNSQERLDLITACSEAERLDRYCIKETLKTRPVCVELESGRDFFTSGSLVMTLSSPLSLDITAGPPSQSEYETFGF
jgi:hypothetical protein